MLESPQGPSRLSRGCPSRPTASLRAPPSVLTAWAGEDASPVPVSTHSGMLNGTLDVGTFEPVTFWLLGDVSNKKDVFHRG